MFDPLFMRTRHDAADIDPRQVDGVGVQRSQGHDLFDLGDADFPASRCGHVEIPCGLAEDKVPRRVGLPGLDDGEVGHDPALKDVGPSVEIVMLLALGDHGADAGCRVEPGDPRAARPHPLGQGALRVELQLQLSRQVLAHEFRVLADIGRDHLLHLPRLQQHPQTEPVHARVVRRDGQALDATVADRRDQQFRDAAQAKAPGGDQHAVLQHALQRRSGAWVNLVHPSLPRLDKRS